MKDKIKILLVYPPSSSIGIYNTPTGLLYIATVLKSKGYNVKLVDCSVEPAYEEILKKEIVDADLFGIYAMSMHIKYLMPLLYKLKKINDKFMIVWGGPHATLFPEQTAKSPFADIVVRGEGEEAMLEIVKGYESGRLNLAQIKGVSFKNNGEIVTTADRDFIDLNTLPFIDWSFVKKEVMDVIRRTIIRVQASRGCPYKCAFCINVVSKNKKMRYRTSENVVNEIEHIYKEHKIQRVGFRDELFMSDREQVKRIAEGIISRNIKITWLANARVEYLRESFVDDAYLQLLVKSGCNKLSTGGESGSQRVLDLLRKGCKVEDIVNFVRRTKRNNIIPGVAFMTGIPTETESEQMETLALIRQLLRIEPRTIINGPANFRPYPGGELYEMCVKKYNLKMPDSLEEWANAEILGGAHPPWVNKMFFNEYIWTSVKAASYSGSYIVKKLFPNPLKGLGIFFLMVISKIRLKYLYYRFPFEFKLLDWYHKFIVKKIPEFS
ncbi:B12-binding domain-containing radical SAM protein [bacterium]|nr:MAG: B12-binding domain-containing radical SAM protein [bacterium]